MRGVLGFGGTARDLLSDLAGDGGSVLFLDNLDFFADEERLTATDLLRECAQIPGISVIATARPDFGITEPSWLPADAIDQKGRAAPVVIYELSDAAPIGWSLKSHEARRPPRNMDECHETNPDPNAHFIPRAMPAQDRRKTLAALGCSRRSRMLPSRAAELQGT
jgi:hypothetical protein